MSRVIIPPHKGVNQSQDEYQFNHWENTKGQETINFSPEVHVLAGTLRPRYVDQHLVVRWLIGITHLAHHKRRCKNLPTSEVAQRHEQCTRVAFGAHNSAQRSSNHRTV